MENGPTSAPQEAVRTFTQSKLLALQPSKLRASVHRAVGGKQRLAHRMAPGSQSNSITATATVAPCREMASLFLSFGPMALVGTSDTRKLLRILGRLWLLLHCAITAAIAIVTAVTATMAGAETSNTAMRTLLQDDN